MLRKVHALEFAGLLLVADSYSARGVRHCLVTEDTVLHGKMSELYPQPEDEVADEPDEPPAAAVG